MTKRKQRRETEAGRSAGSPKSKKSTKSTRPKLTGKIVQKLRAAGAYVEKVKGEPLVNIRMDFGDAAFKIFESWYTSLSEDADPEVVAIVAPPPNIAGTIIAPDPTIRGPLQTECNALIHHFGPLGLADFADGAVAPIIPPAAAVPVPVQVHHASFSLSKIFEAILNPPAVGCPILNNLAGGSYICQVTQSWSGAVVTVMLFKV